MNMNMNLSATSTGRMVDLPFWIRNGDWDNGSANCETAGSV